MLWYALATGVLVLIAAAYFFTRGKDTSNVQAPPPRDNG